jgi:uncharacterized protein
MPAARGGHTFSTMSLSDRLATRVLGLAPARTDYRVTPVRTPATSGFDLAGDHYEPVGPAKGTLLVRSPYGRSAPFNLLYAKIFAARGYHVLFQSVRGTFGSGGPFEPMVNEVDDAHDTVAWLREQPWFDGRLATTGLSYLGYTQWALLTDPPPELRTAIIQVGPHDFWHAVHGTGAFTLNDFVGWSDLVAHQEQGGRLAALIRFARADQRVRPAMSRLPIEAAGDDLFDGGAAWYRDWVGHPDGDDPFWKPMRLRAALDNVRVPVLLVGGWQDLFLRQTLAQYERLRDSPAGAALLMGPWTHNDIALRGAPAIARSSLAWLDHHLAGAGTAPPNTARVYVTGAKRWRDLPAYPPPSRPRTLWLSGRRLTAGEPAPDAAAATFTYDPADPTPTVGGRVLSHGAGIRKTNALEARPDVLTFTGDPLPAPVEVLGVPVVELRHGSDNPHADLFVRLCEVDAKGVSRNVSDGYVRLAAATPEPSTVRLELDPIAHRFGAGHRLRLLVAGGSHPHFARNLGTDEPAATGTTLRRSTRTVTAASTLTVPVTG